MRISHGLALLGVVALGLMAPVARAQDLPPRAFAGEDLFRLEGATDPQISPDGRTIVYVCRTGDIMKDRYHASLWLVDVNSGAQRPLVAGVDGAMAPRWSPHSRRISYTKPAPATAGN